MEKYRLHFVSVANSRFARVIEFSIEIEARSLKDANLIGARMTGEESWSFVRAVAVEHE